MNESAALVDLARRLLTPGARINEQDDGEPHSLDEWIKGQIRWHRLDDNDALADEMLAHENKVRRALGKEPFDV